MRGGGIKYHFRSDVPLATLTSSSDDVRDNSHALGKPLMEDTLVHDDRRDTQYDATLGPRTFTDDQLLKEVGPGR